MSPYKLLGQYVAEAHSQREWSETCCKRRKVSQLSLPAAQSRVSIWRLVTWSCRTSLKGLHDWPEEQ